MFAQPTPRFTHEEFLDREAQSPFRHEFRRGRIEMMAGGTMDHSLIENNCSASLQRALAGRGCRIVGPDLLLRIEQADVSTYPDVMVICDSPNFLGRRKIIIDNPIVIVEVLSPSTESYDRGEKFDAYRQLPSLRDFVLIHQKEPRIEVFSLQSDGSWNPTEVSGMNATLTLESRAIKVPLTSIYELVEF
jgi:Uma2 family endonuclease